MSPRRRNIVVGIVVLVGLGIIAWMILMFAGTIANWFSPAGESVVLKADQATGVTKGSAVYYLGVQVGHVTQVRRGADNQSVLIDAQVNKEPPLPANLHGIIRTESALGMAASILLQHTGPPEGSLKSGAVLTAEYEGNALIPKQFTELAEDLRRQELIKHLDETVLSMHAQAERAGQVLEAVRKIVADPTLQTNLRAALASIRSAADSASRVGANMEKFSGNLQTVGDQANATMSEVRVAVASLSTTLDHFQSVATKIDQGKGTAGMLVNDPKLYQGLTDTTRELNLTVADLRRVVQQWEQEGVTLKLGK